MVILSKGCKPDNFESNDSLKLSFTNIRGLRSNFVDCQSFLESNSCALPYVLLTFKALTIFMILTLIIDGCTLKAKMLITFISFFFKV